MDLGTVSAADDLWSAVQSAYPKHLSSKYAPVRLSAPSLPRYGLRSLCAANLGSMHDVKTDEEDPYKVVINDGVAEAPTRFKLEWARPKERVGEEDDEVKAISIPPKPKNLARVAKKFGVFF